MRTISLTNEQHEYIVHTLRERRDHIRALLLTPRSPAQVEVLQPELEMIKSILRSYQDD